MRTKQQVFAFTGHANTVSAIQCQAADPQIITGSSDSTVKLWDLAAGKCMTTLTHHKKGIRAVAINHSNFTFSTASTGSIRQWNSPNGDLIQNLDKQKSVINTLSINQDQVMVSGGKPI
jgi:pleiotropic regulator 1